MECFAIHAIAIWTKEEGIKASASLVQFHFRQYEIYNPDKLHVIIFSAYI